MAVDRVQRRMAAILAADVVGYSRLMGKDEEATLATLKAHREVIDRLIADHGGRIFGSAGDSVIAEFPASVAYWSGTYKYALFLSNDSFSTKQTIRKGNLTLNAPA